VQDQLQQARDEVGRLEAKGLGGNGLVQATISGENVLVALTVDTSVIDPNDPETLSELVREAVNDAIVKLSAQRDKRLSSATEGFTGILSGAERPPILAPILPARLLQPPRPDNAP
jgi:DNA-binding YbaB/EbfC family protein